MVGLVDRSAGLIYVSLSELTLRLHGLIDTVFDAQTPNTEIITRPPHVQMIHQWLTNTTSLHWAYYQTSSSVGNIFRRKETQKNGYWRRFDGGNETKFNINHTKCWCWSENSIVHGVGAGLPFCFFFSSVC